MDTSPAFAREPLQTGYEDRSPPGPPIVDFAVVHHISGRVRLRVPRLRDGGGLAEKVEALLERQPGVHAVRVAAACASVTVTFDDARVSVTRIGVWLQEAPDHTTRRKTLTRRESVTALIAGAAAVAASAIGLPPVAVAALLSISAAPIAIRAASTMAKEGAISVDVLDGIAVALLAGQGATFAASLSSTLIAGGEHIRSLTARQSHAALTGLLSSSDSFAWIVRGRRRDRIRADELQPGDVVVVYPGEILPVDGIIIEGRGLVDEKTLSGESIPVPKADGDEVFASTLLREGKLYIETRRAGQSTRASRVIQILESAPAHETRLTNFARRFADRLVLPTLALAAVSYVLTRNVSRAISILIFDLATGIRISAPTTMLASMTTAARAGVLVKTAASLERLATIDTVVFDKTGTLTTGQAEVCDVRSVDASRGDDEILALAASAEQRLVHPVAAAIVRAAAVRGLRVPERSASKYKVGMGVRAWIDGHRVRVGEMRYLRRKHIRVPDRVLKRAEAAAGAGASLVYVTVDETVAGYVTYRDALRPEAKDVVERLRERGVARIIIVTGDHPRVARSVASDLCLTEVHAGVFPEDKSKIVRRLQQGGCRVAVVGDGINDSPALAYADVSISIEGGAEAARESADIVLHGDLHGLPLAIDIARHSMRLISQNMAIVATPNIVGMCLAASGAIGPLASTALNNGSTVVAGINSVRPLKALPPPRDTGRAATV